MRDGIQTALGVQHARFWPGAGRADLPLLTRDGRVVPTLSKWTGRGFELPEVVSIPVVSGRGVLGHIEIDSTPGRSVSIDERRVTVALGRHPRARLGALLRGHRPAAVAPVSRVRRVRPDASSVELRKGPLVADLVFIVIVVAFFALCVGYVRLCDRIIGPDSPGREPADVHAATSSRRSERERALRLAGRRQLRRARAGRRLLVLLVAVLVFPERF